MRAAEVPQQKHPEHGLRLVGRGVSEVTFLFVLG